MRTAEGRTLILAQVVSEFLGCLLRPSLGLPWFSQRQGWAVDCADELRVDRCLFGCSRSGLSEDCVRRREMWENVDENDVVRVM